ncbi:MAG: U32 family peptidase, partial [Clostridiaceae bacterium]|nr:U32 family peptidase [Clostridiaceae bacterium]
MKCNKPELLAPCGDQDAFKAAVENGADAVYLGGRLFNARQFAANFDSEKLKEASDYAHVRAVNVYLAMNTLMSEGELGKALEFLQEAYLAGIDGVIVQDLGFAALVRKAFPDLPLHASTQMTIYNIEGVRTLEKIGFKRVVLARELSLEEIGSICTETGLEVEVFAHGALCTGYSGQCLMSSIIGGRSGNRGKCAQPCRLPYELEGENPNRNSSINRGYYLSPKDLCTVGLLGEIAATGVKSLKIEGRMKSPEYVATVVRIYRKYLNRVFEKGKLSVKYAIDEQDLSDLLKIFNRGGFSEGYFKGKTGKDMMSYEKPKNWGVYLGDVIT